MGLGQIWVGYIYLELISPFGLIANNAVSL